MSPGLGGDDETVTTSIEAEILTDLGTRWPGRVTELADGPRQPRMQRPTHRPVVTNNWSP
jgi:hypothetical protein